MTTPNAELAYRVLDHIDAHPEQHNPRVWIEDRGDCGTAACMAGWTCLLAGDQPRFHGDGDPEAEFVIHTGMTRGDYIPDRAAELLGMKPDGGVQTDFRLFEPSNTREDLGRLVAEIFGPRPAWTAADEQVWRECAHRADYLTPAEHANNCAYHRGEVDADGWPIEPVALDYGDAPPNAGSAS